MNSEQVSTILNGTPSYTNQGYDQAWEAFRQSDDVELKRAFALRMLNSTQSGRFIGMILYDDIFDHVKDLEKFQRNVKYAHFYGPLLRTALARQHTTFYEWFAEHYPEQFKSVQIKPASTPWSNYVMLSNSTIYRLNDNPLVQKFIQSRQN